MMQPRRDESLGLLDRRNERRGQGVDDRNLIRNVNEALPVFSLPVGRIVQGKQHGR